jgi:sugar lactone lactonase YvrE
MNIARISALLFCFMGILIAASAQNRRSSGRDSTDHRYQSDQTALLPQDAKWYNTDRSFNIGAQKDRLVIVHLWDPNSVECQASIAKANDWHKRYPHVVVVTIVRSDVAEEKSERSVQRWIERHRINHPVVVTNDLSKLDFNSRKRNPILLGIQAGSSNLETLYGIEGVDSYDAILSAFTREQISNNGWSTVAFMMPKSAPAIYEMMRFPTAIVTSNRDQRMYVADTYNNRVLVLDADGFVSDVIGTGTAGFRDGRYGACQLNKPQGLALDEATRKLYISDTHNHALREVDLATKEVITILGNGKRSEVNRPWVDSTAAELSFPTGLALGAGKVFIAMTGTNQIWEYDVATHKAKSAAGDRIPMSVDGERTQSSFNLPVSIAAGPDGSYYILDAGSGKIRKADPGWVITTVEIPETEFSLRGATGLLYSDGKLFIADGHQHRILQYDGSKVSLVTGGPNSGFSDHKKREALFSHPTGMAMLNEQLHVVDQNNFAIRTVNLKKGRTRTVSLRNYDLLFSNIEAFSEGDQFYLEEVVLGRGSNSLFIEMKLEPDLDWEPAGRNEVFLDYAGSNRLLTSVPRRGFIEVECPGTEMNANINLQIYVTVRSKETKRVYFRPVILFVPFVYEESAETVHDVSWRPFADKK